MSIIYGEIITNKIEDTLDSLRRITIEEQPFIKPKDIFFIGKISQSTFKLITFDAPPTEVGFYVSTSSIKIKINKNSLASAFTALIYGLGYPISVALFIWGMMDKNIPIIAKLFFVCFLAFPFLLNKLVKKLYQSYIMKRHDNIFNELEKRLEVRVIKQNI